MADKKEIGINQRIPLHVLEAGLVAFLNGSYSSDYIAEQLRLDFEGENRIAKVVVRVDKTIPNSPLADYLLEHKAAILNALKNKSDRNIILMALVNAAYPFCFKVTQLFGRFFKVQDIINTELIRSSISKEYGSNRSTHNGLYSSIPMLLEAGFFSRPRPGIYEPLPPLQIQHQVSRDIYLKSFQLNMPGYYSNGVGEWGDPYFGFVEG